MSWKPSLRAGIDLKALTLSPTQGYVLSRLDGATDLHHLGLVTRLPEERLSGILRELVQLGAVTADPAAPEGARPPADAVSAEGASAEEEHLEDTPPDEGDAEHEARSKTHRALYATELRELTIDARVTRAQTAVEPMLSALCFDPQAPVILALLDNDAAGPVQARLIAAHHPTSVGLDALTARAHFAADLGVRRALLKNAHLTVALYRRLWGNRRLLEQFKVAVSREVGEGTRRASRETLRSRFTTAVPEERVELIMKTEGRCLAMLAGLPIDSKTTSQLCGRTYGSSMLVQNLARWSPCPPQLVAHLLRQELVKRSPMLRTLLERHPNAPHGGV